MRDRKNLKSTLKPNKFPQDQKRQEQERKTFSKIASESNVCCIIKKDKFINIFNFVLNVFGKNIPPK